MTEVFNHILAFFQQYGTVGLFLLAFIESFISPILPDVLLIPMALANPERAIYYSCIATGASVLGGFIGYYIGAKLGLPALKRVVPERYIVSIQNWLSEYGSFAVFIAAMAPIPYKFTCIAAGAFRVSMPAFVIASVLGRAKRFLVEGILIYLYGQKAIDLMQRYSNNLLIGGVLLVIVTLLIVHLQRNSQKAPDNE